MGRYLHCAIGACVRGCRWHFKDLDQLQWLEKLGIVFRGRALGHAAADKGVSIEECKREGSGEVARLKVWGDVMAMSDCERCMRVEICGVHDLPSEGELVGDVDWLKYLSTGMMLRGSAFSDAQWGSGMRWNGGRETAYAVGYGGLAVGCSLM